MLTGKALERFNAALHKTIQNYERLADLDVHHPLLQEANRFSPQMLIIKNPDSFDKKYGGTEGNGSVRKLENYATALDAAADKIDNKRII